MKPNRLAFLVAGAAILTIHLDLHGADPVLVGQWPGYARGQAQALVVAGNYAYVAAHSGGLHIIDFSDVSNPKRVGGYDKGGFYARAVAVSSHYAYVVGFLWDGPPQAVSQVLQIIDISNRANPILVARYNVSGYAAAVAVSGNYAYVAGGIWDNASQTNSDGLQIVDISDPVNPHRIAGHDTSGSASGVSVLNNYAYVSDSGFGLRVIDISDPTNPRRAGARSMIGQPWAVHVSGNYAYVAAWGHWDSVRRVYVGGGLQVIDISNPENPQWVGEYEPGLMETYGVNVSGNYAYLAGLRYWDSGTQAFQGGGLQIIDISNPANPQRAGEYQPSGNGIGGNDIWQLCVVS